METFRHIYITVAACSAKPFPLWPNKYLIIYAKWNSLKRTEHRKTLSGIPDTLVIRASSFIQILLSVRQSWV